MKSLATVFLSAFFLTTALANNTTPTVQLERSEYLNQNVLTFKIDKELIGSTLELIDADGNVLSVDELNKKRLTIDFSDLDYSEYVVRIKKDEFIRVFKIFNDIEKGVLYENHRE